jgi:signal transduction histidine kinase
VNTTLDRLEAAYEQLRRFTSDASHEIRSPLTAIRTQVEEALMHPHEANWPQVGQSVLVAAERLHSLMIDLLALARLDAGTSLTFEPADLTQLVEAELSRRAYAVRIVKDLRKGMFIRCDRAQITRLLADLMDNAERHAASEVTVTVQGDERSAVLAVVDDGAGIPAEKREVVFSRFTRLDTARSPDTGGAGLGLAIARRIAEAHGGTLIAEDSAKGARLVLRLPRCDPPDTEAAGLGV